MLLVHTPAGTSIEKVPGANPRPIRVTLFYSIAALIAAPLDVTVLSIYAWARKVFLAAVSCCRHAPKGPKRICHSQNSSGVYYPHPTCLIQPRRAKSRLPVSPNSIIVSGTRGKVFRVQVMSLSNSVWISIPPNATLKMVALRGIKNGESGSYKVDCPGSDARLASIVVCHLMTSPNPYYDSGVPKSAFILIGPLYSSSK